MNKQHFTTIAVLVAGLVAGYAIARLQGTDEISPVPKNGEREVLYWKAPMDPNFRSDQPGKSPMGMDLVPVYADDGEVADENALQISPAVVNNLGVRTALVERGSLRREISTVGFVAPDDDLSSHVHVRVDGWIERLFVKTEGERVKKGDLLFQMYSPTLVNAQTEYLQALRISQTGLAAASRERLKALGMTASQIDKLKASGKADELVDVRATQDGIVLELNIGEGMFVKPGTTVAVLADLSSIWVLVEVYEDQANWVEEGQDAVMRLPFVPGRTWQGKIDYVYPTIDPVSRTLRVRLEFPNTGEFLKPNMYTEVELYGSATQSVLHIPRQALIRTGKSERVILALGEGRFRPAMVTSGVESGARIEIVSGLAEGETIVTSGQFLLDSEASLDASLLRMQSDVPIPMTMAMPADEVEVMDMPGNKPGDMPEDEQAMDHSMDHSGHDMDAPVSPTGPILSGTGTVNSVMAGHGMINITHGPIDALDWPAMTMDFMAASDVDLSGISVGDEVVFNLGLDEDGDYQIIEISVTPQMDHEGHKDMTGDKK